MNPTNGFEKLGRSGRPKAVVFDHDGLIFNTEDLYQDVGGELLRRRGCAFTPELLDRMMGRPGRIALQIMIDMHHLEATVDQLTAETDEIFPAILDARLETMPGFMELAAALEKAGIPKAIATSSRRSFVVGCLARFQLEPRFQFILSAEDVVEGKPNPEIYLTAAKRFGLRSDEIMVLEDSQNGCRAAVAAGAIAVAVPSGHSRTHSFPGAAFEAETLADPRIYELLKI
ncbi:MAG: HAD family phosphatase [Planctomycetia bacterium]|nr:HAD family phosphatase [Planctomycetia bacterium]